ncbi:MAG: DUF2213 domain-containing protein [Candidatus Bathyarchaeota archaeon]|nr:DUF2213 domain-containing protein [Candidatus Termiticorpusculum sp.]
MSTTPTSEYKVVFDIATLDKAVVSEDDDTLTMSAVIASEIVHKYAGGMAYKPGDELEKMVYTASRIGSVPIKVLEHPGFETDFLLLKHNDVHGKAGNFQFVKDLLDPKTKRPNRRGVRADITWFKDVTPPIVITKLKDGTLRDVSIGFVCEMEWTEGVFNGEKYDYVQRNIFLNHVAAPVDAGRCPGPICGIGADKQNSTTNMVMVDRQVLESCPVCNHMKEVGWQTAGQRLYDTYGPNVLEVIDTGKLPPTPPSQPTIAPTVDSVEQKTEDPQVNSDAEFRKVVKEFHKTFPTS